MREILKRKLEDLKKDEEKAIAQLNAILGAKSVVIDLIKEAGDEEKVEVKK